MASRKNTHTMALGRRAFLRRGAMLGGGLVALGPLHALGLRTASGAPLKRTTGYGPLVPKGDLKLPPEFNYQVISRQGQPMSDGEPTPGIFDGMAAYSGRNQTTILIRNHENRERPGEIPVVVPPEDTYDPATIGGCTKLVVRRNRRTGVFTVVESFAIIGGTSTNCAGGVAGRSWVTCEEVVKGPSSSPPVGTSLPAPTQKHGYNFEVPADANGPIKARPIKAAGRMSHEAVAWLDGILYQTEDRSIGPDALTEKKQLGACFYRYIPDGDFDDDDDDEGGRFLNLANTTGRVEALKLRDEFHADMDRGRVVGQPYPVEWVPVPEPDHDDETDNRRDRQPGFTPMRVQAQDRGAAFFDRQEGMWLAYGEDDDDDEGAKIYFDCTTGGAQNLGQVWEYDPERETITLIYESADPARLEAPDNIVINPYTGHIFVCEDGEGQQYIRGLTPEGHIYDFAMTITNNTEFCGACFDPRAQVLYVNQQGERGGLPDGPADGQAVTYAIFGPFDKLVGGDDDDDD